MTDPVLTVDKILGGYGRHNVLREVSLTVPRSSVVALLGANGAGKTTLLKTVSGLLNPTSGRIRLAGEDVTGLPAHRRARRGLCHIAEGRAVFRNLTVRENLIMQAAGGRTSLAIERATSAFPILGARLGQRAGTLSGGQQQMLAMAQAYIGDPKLILVDEASLGLAPVIVDEIFEFLEQVTAGGASLLIVDQFAARVLRIADVAYVLRRGEIAYAGPADVLVADDLFERYVGTT
jgi:branched-chain amino acid transport system ATP-binding protein